MRDERWAAGEIVARLDAALEQARQEGLVAVVRVLLVQGRNERRWRPFFGRVDIARKGDPPEVATEEFGTEVRVQAETVELDDFIVRLAAVRAGAPLDVDGLSIQDVGFTDRPDHIWRSSVAADDWGVWWPCNIVSFSIPDSAPLVSGLLEGPRSGTVSGIYALVAKVSGFRVYHHSRDARHGEFGIYLWDYRGRFVEASITDAGLAVRYEPPEDARLRVRGVVTTPGGDVSLPWPPAPDTGLIALPTGATRVELELVHEGNVVDDRAVPIPEWRGQLDAVAARVGGGDAPATSVRELLRWFGAERRGSQVVASVRKALEGRSIRTEPDFADVWIDAPILFTSARAHDTGELDGSGAGGPSGEAPTASAVASPSGTATIIRADPVVRLARLTAANHPAVHVSPDASVESAATLMVLHAFSQLPVVTGKNSIKGSVTWEGILKCMLQGAPRTIQSCMEPPRVHEATAPLLAVLPEIVREGFILVKNGPLVCVVTAADVAAQFHESTEAFLLIAEIEQHLRGLIGKAFSIEELKAIRDPNDSDRAVDGVDDLSFGEYVRLLQRPDAWLKFSARLDRVAVVQRLEAVNEIRNNVMHFEPDGVGEKSLELLRATARFFERLA